MKNFVAFITEDFKVFQGASLFHFGQNFLVDHIHKYFLINSRQHTEKIFQIAGFWIESTQCLRNL
jgi:hypothetical protein